MRMRNFNIIFLFVPEEFRLFKMMGGRCHIGRLTAGWSGCALMLGKLSVPCHPLMKIGQGSTALAVDAGGGCLDIFLPSNFSLFFSLYGRRSDIN